MYLLCGWLLTLVTDLGHCATLKTSRGNGERQQRAWEWIGMMSKWMWHSNRSPQSLSFIDDSVSLDELWLSLPLTDAAASSMATVTMLKLRMRAVTALNSFHRPTCFHRRRSPQTHCAWLEMWLMHFSWRARQRDYSLVIYWNWEHHLNNDRKLESAFISSAIDFQVWEALKPDGNN